VPALRLSAVDRAATHMLASLLLDYPDAAWFGRLPALRPHIDALPSAISEP
jgi:nitrate reductase delta subunit